MRPIVTPGEMAAIDEAAGVSVEELVERAGTAVATAAIDLLAGRRSVAVVAGKGSNGADGRVAARLLAEAGIRVAVIDAAEAPARLDDVDLVVDAAYGTGLGRPYEAPATDADVLAVDLPSGIDGLTGRRLGRPARAARTVTFAALKPGHLLGDGPAWCGEVVLADIGLDVSSSTIAEVEWTDVAALVPGRPADAHKWDHACWVVAGSPGMTGAAVLAARAAQRSGAGYVRLSVPGGAAAEAPLEVVEHPLNPDLDLADADRFASLVVGPGLGATPAEAVRRVAAGVDRPLVVDGDGLRAIVDVAVLAGRRTPAVLTPHDGEFAHLAGGSPGDDRIAAAQSLAATAGAVVLLKGPTTVVAAPGGLVRIARCGDQRLATAGSGDVLAGIIGGFLARGAEPFDAASAAVVVHGALLDDLPATGVVAGDLDRDLPGIMVAMGIDDRRGR